MGVMIVAMALDGWAVGLGGGTPPTALFAVLNVH